VATSELASGLQADYKLSGAELATVLGVAMEYNVSEIADRNVGVIAKIRKAALVPLEPTK
jgi:hypothetical protein